jgi:hypothetical protein
MIFARQVHPKINERAAAHTRLHVMDAPTESHAPGFAFAQRDGDTANRLLRLFPGRQHATDSLALLRQMKA